MDYKEIKRKFKILCKEDKRPCYNYSFLGRIVAILGFITVVITFILARRLIIPYPSYLVLYALGCVFAVVGLIIYSIGESIFKNDLKNIIRKMEGKNNDKRKIK